MKRIAIVMISVLMVVALVVGGTAIMAAKPQDAGNKGMDVIAKSNGFPSGPHFNLNIHGKDPLTFTCPDDDPLFEGWGSSVFISDNTEDTKIYYLTNKKGNVDVLTVIDGCGVFDGEVKVQLPAIPKNVSDPGLQGYHVFARILGKPNNSKKTEGDPSYMMLSPNSVDTICNDPVQDPDTGEWSCPDEVSLGLILLGGVYVDEGTEFRRFEDPTAKGKGKSKAVDITALFTYEGWVVDPILDIYPAPDGDGLMTVGDIPVFNWDCGTEDPLDPAYTPPNRDVNGLDGENSDLMANFDPVTKELDPDLEMYLQYMALTLPAVDIGACWDWASMLGLPPDPDPRPLAWDFSAGMWILNIADYVLTWQDVTNDGAKLLQVRFYPRWTTDYIPPE